MANSEPLITNVCDHDLHDRCDGQVQNLVRIKGKPGFVRFSKRTRPCECRCHERESDDD